MKISEESIKSLFIRSYSNGQLLKGNGTAFVVVHQSRPFLITNWHCVTGIDPITSKLIHGIAIPDQIEIRYSSDVLHEQDIWRTEALFKDEEKLEKLWLEHPVYGKKVDVIALPLTNLGGVKLFPYSLEPGPIRNEIMVGCGEVVSVIGFPFGLSGQNGTAIWATGFLATEPDLEYGDLPCFLVDCRSRSGQSGSAVVAHRFGPYRNSSYEMVVFDGVKSRLLGVYSGRINEQSDLGFVWKVDAVRDILNGEQPFQHQITGLSAPEGPLFF